MRTLLFLLTTAVVVLLLSETAPAQILLKPAGGSALPLRTRSLDTEVTIEGQIAQTKLTLLFQNETPGRIEADFIYTLPKNTLVTYFAYWYGEEKVVARIVEKERAAAIYGSITARMRDPALIELIGKDMFRARIFPVMPGADLKVEMTLVQALPSTPEGALYALPLRVETKTDALESVKVAVRVKGGAGVLKVTNNYGLPVEEDSGGYRLALSGTNFRPSKDLRVNLVRAPRPLDASLYAAPSSPGGDGFFALALTPNATLSKPVARIAGVRTYDVIADRPPVLRAHEALIVVGRYKGSGPATVALGALRQPIQFESLPEPNNVASKLWAARRIAQLSAGRSGEETVIALSKRFTLPSKFTSWLAVPKAELERYEREKDYAEMSVAAQQLAAAIREGRGDTRRARLIRARLEALARKIGGNRAQDVLRGQLDNDLRRLSREIRRAGITGRSAEARRLEGEFRRICRALGLNPERELNNLLRDEADGEIHATAEELARELIAEQPNTAQVRRLRARLAALGRRTGQSPSALLRMHLNSQLDVLASDLVLEQRKPNPDPVRVAALESRLRRLEGASGRAMESRLRAVEHRLTLNEIYLSGYQLQREFVGERGEGEAAKRLRARVRELARAAGYPLQSVYSGSMSWLASQLAEEVAAGRGENERAEALRRQHADLAGEAGVDPRQNLREQWQWREQNLAQQIAFEKRRGNPDEANMAETQARLERLAGAAGETPEKFLAEAERSYAQGFERTRSELLEERRKSDPDQRRIAELEARFRTQHDQPWRPKEFVDARLERLAVEVELDKLEKVQGPPGPETSRRRAELEERERELHARMGDPLIQVEAPEDAEQVIALLPGGEIKRLEWNRDARRWEARFDIPTYASEGTYEIRVIIVGRNGARRTLALRYHVDVTPPAGSGSVRAATTDASALRLELDASDDTARVSALLPWGEQIALRPSPGRSSRFFALVPVPSGAADKAHSVTFVLTDRAHNRTTVTVDAAR